MARGVKWYDDRIRAITTTGPERAHELAAAQAAGIGAQMIDSSGTGTLARDVAAVKKIGPMHSAAGSNLAYARIENDGGTITPKRAKRLLIRGKRGRSSYGAPVVASADSVQHVGKHYLEAILEAFPRLFVDLMRRR